LLKLDGSLSEKIEPELLEDLTLLANQHSQWLDKTSVMLNTKNSDDSKSDDNDLEDDAEQPFDFVAPKGTKDVPFPFKFPRAWPFFGYLLEFLHAHVLWKTDSLFSGDLAEVRHYTTTSQSVLGHPSPKSYFLLCPLLLNTPHSLFRKNPSTAIRTMKKRTR
jgi:hypothetical protein